MSVRVMNLPELESWCLNMENIYRKTNTHTHRNTNRCLDENYLLCAKYERKNKAGKKGGAQAQTTNGQC